MQWKPIFCAVVLGLPSLVNAQVKKPTTDGKKLAFLENSVTGDNVTIANGTKVIQPDSILIADPNRKDQHHSVKTNPKDDEILGIKNVPLIGELDYYGKMNNLMISYCKSYFSNFSRRLDVGGPKNRTLDIMSGILEKNGLPPELRYLAVIESALNKDARSPVGAVGYWQFMAPTAMDMGLTVNKHRDDRRDLYKSTYAAAKYLNLLYDQFDDWLLVIAAYNSGPRPVIDAMKKTGKGDFWSLKRYLPKETQNHVMAFVATATIMERLQDYIKPGLPSNFDWATLNRTDGKSKVDPKKYVSPLLARFSEDEVKKMAIVRITEPLDIELISSALNIDRRLLGRWNYDYYDFLENYKKGNTFNLRIPKDKLDQFIEKKSFLERNSIVRVM